MLTPILLLLTEGLSRRKSESPCTLLSALAREHGKREGATTSRPLPCTSRHYFKWRPTSFVISNMSTVALPPKTAFSVASALIVRLAFGSCSLFFLM